MKALLIASAIFLSFEASAALTKLTQFAGESRGVAISENGIVLVELSPKSGSITQYAGIWRPAQNSLIKGKPVAGFTAAFPTGINSRGEAAGFSSRAQVPHFHATFWEADGKEVALPHFGDDWASVAMAMNEDTIVGYSLGNGQRPTLWKKTDGQWKAVELPRIHDLATIRAISPDGKTCVGQDGGFPVRWTVDGAGNWTEAALSKDYGNAFAINAAGQITGIVSELKTIKGESYATNEAVLFTSAGYTRLGFIGSFFLSKPSGITRDGRIVGYSNDLHDGYPFVWSASSGMRRLNIDHDLGDVRGVNASGQITGVAFQATGEEEVAYIATLP